MVPKIHTRNIFAAQEPMDSIYAMRGVKYINTDKNYKYIQIGIPSGCSWRKIEENAFVSFDFITENIALGGDAIWGDITGDINDQTDLVDLIETLSPDNFSYEEILATEEITIPERQQMIVQDMIIVNGVLNIEGTLVII